MRRYRVCCTGHGATSDHRQVLLVVDGRLRIKALLRADLAQRRVGSWLLQICRRRMRSRVVTDQVQMLTSRGGDAERLLHQAIRLISIPIWALIRSVASILIATPAFWSFASPRYGAVRHAATSSLALHLSIRQKAAGYSTGAP